MCIVGQYCSVSGEAARKGRAKLIPAIAATKQVHENKVLVEVFRA